MSDLKIQFGKYKDVLLSDLIYSDPGYCKWLNNQEFTDANIKEYIQANVSMEPIMRWGKYKGKLLSYIHNTDYKYIKWLLGNEYVINKCPDLLIELKKLHPDNVPTNIHKDAETQTL